MDQIPDGPPIPMSEFTLGDRYGSEDMYRDMGITPGSLVSVEIDGVLYTDYLKNMTPRPPVRRLSRWQRLTRRLTPKRFRKPLYPPSPAQRALALVTKTQQFLDGLTK